MATAVVAGLVLSSCGESEPEAPEPRHAVTDAVHRLQDAFDRGSTADVCALMTKSAQVQAGNVAHSSPTTCVQDVRRVFKLIGDGGGWLDQEKPRVVAVRADDETTWATVATDGWEARIPFVRKAGTWKLAGFFGVPPHHLSRVERQAPTGSFPPPGRAVRVADASGVPCDPISADRYPVLAGGCEIRISEPLAPVEMLTPFGGFKFGDCSVDYRVVVDRDGRTWTDEWEIESEEEESGCSDINPCIRERNGIVDRLPWRGRIRSDGDGGFLHRMDMCLRTCIGLFAGEYVVRLEPDDEGWKVAPNDGDATGFRFAEPLAVEGERLKIDAAADSADSAG